LVESWRSRGGAAADGLDLLLWQAADQIRIFTGSEPPLAQMRAALMAGDADVSLTRPG
jgi:shikimate 5-dehydrogenase